jgi:hypothetical protein
MVTADEFSGEALRAAWVANDVEAVRRLHAARPLTLKDLLTPRPVEKKTLEWLMNNFAFTEDNMAAADQIAVITLCAQGEFAKLKAVHAQHGISPECVGAWRHIGFKSAWAGGHLAIAKWLHETFQLTAGDVCRDNHFACRMAISRGHPAVAHWIMDTFMGG